MTEPKIPEKYKAYHKELDKILDKHWLVFLEACIKVQAQHPKWKTKRVVLDATGATMLVMSRIRGF